MDAAPPRTVAIVPVRSLEGAKSRLGEVLDAEERRALVERLLRQTIAACADSGAIDEIVVISQDPEVLALGAEAGATPMPQLGQGLNGAIREARDALAARDRARADRLVILPPDLPRVSAAAVAGFVALAGDRRAEPVVALAPDRHGRGTNALLLQPPGVIDTAFGGDSRATHRSLALAEEARYVEAEGPLSLDVDTPDDLLLAERGNPELTGAG